MLVAARILHNIDRHGGLDKAIEGVLFFGSAALSVYVLLWSVDLPAQLEYRDIDPLGSAFVAWIMLFVVWIFTFLAVLWLLDAMGIRDVRRLARARRSKLTLNSAELGALGKVVESRKKKHGRLYKTVLIDLAYDNRNRHGIERRIHSQLSAETGIR